jgi:hypothetical protein
MSCNSFSFQYIKLLFQVFFISVCNQLSTTLAIVNSLQVDVIWFMFYPYLISLILKVQHLLCFNLMNKGLSSLIELFCTNLCTGIYLTAMICKL